VTSVFADSFYYIALLNPPDRTHRAAVLATENLAGRVITTTWVLMEVADAMSAPNLREIAHEFLIQLPDEPNTTVVVANDPWYWRGLNLYGRRPDKAWSLTDCISFEVMAEHGLTDALTGDHHFQQAGFRALLKEVSSS
jgi:predicted nucleic acid-binding protein